MNKIHNIIWSHAQNAWVVVAEGTKAASKAGGAGLKVMVALIMLSPVAGNAATLPQGGTISVGTGTIVTNGSNEMVIKQTTDKLGINWQSFNVGADGHVIFDQPGTSSVALNRVIGTDGSAILGKIDANGQVILINPNGVIFGKDAKVNVGGLVASTMDLTDANFKAAKYKFAAGTTKGDVVNEGSIQAAEGGYVAILGRSVKNNGLIKAQLGMAALAAGDAVKLDFSGDSLINVQVTKSALKSLAENHGLIQADGGSVLMTARATNSLMETVVNNDGVLQAQTISNIAGNIYLDAGSSDDNGGIVAAGKLDASAPTAGDGGSINLEGQRIGISSTVDFTTKSQAGNTGSLSISTTDLNVSTVGGATGSSSIAASTLSDSLEKNNVYLTSYENPAFGFMGDININADVAWSSNNLLSLYAGNNVNLYKTLFVNGDSSSVSMIANGRFNALEGGSIKLNGANTTYSENYVNYGILRTVDDLLKLTGPSASGKNYVLGGDIDATVMQTWNGGHGFQGYGNAGNGTSVSNTRFNGLGNTISNFYSNWAGVNYTGLFGTFSYGTLSNLNISGTVIGGSQTGMAAGQIEYGKVYNVTTSGVVSGGQQVGGVAGMIYSESVVDGLHSSATVTASSDRAGGVIGYSYANDLLNNLTYSGDISGTRYVGGVLGDSNSTIALSNLESHGTVTGTGMYVGGVIGSMPYGALSNIKSTSIVKGSASVGGLIGDMQFSSLDNAYATGDATASAENAGGLVGYSGGNTITNSLSSGKVSGTDSVGGLIGNSSLDTVKTSFSTSQVSGTSNVGGFVGQAYQSDYENVYSTGDVNASAGSSGGFMGSSFQSTITNTMATGKNNSSSGLNNGGFIGLSDADTILNSFWNTDGATVSGGAGGTGKTSEELKHASTFAGWGISSTGLSDGNAWRIYEGQTGPMLKFLMGSAVVQQTDAVTTYTSLAYAPGSLTTTLSGVTSNNFFADLLDLSASGIQGGGFAGAPDIINAGTYYETSGLYSNQFGLNLAQASLGKVLVNKATLNFTATGSDKVYDANTNATVSLTASGLGSDVITVTGYDAKFDDKNAGSGKSILISDITLSGSANGNYTWGDVATTADIAKANLVVSAVASDKVYDGSAVATTSLADNRIAGDSLSVSAGTSSFADKNAGAGKTVNVSGITLSGADANNYNVNSTATSTAEIAKANLVVSAVASDKVYDGSAVATTSLADNRIAGDDFSVSSASSSFSDKNAGVGKTVNVSGITLSGADAGNYNVNSTATSTASIAKANLVVSAVASDKVYDGSAVATTSLTDNRITGDSLSVNAGTSSFADKNAGVGKTVNVSGITVSGADANNYNVNTTATSTASIAKANLVVSAVASDKVYDGSAVATTSLADNRIAGDSLAVSAGTSSFADKNAGVGKMVNVSGITLSGADAGNYNVNSTATSTADIARANLIVSAVASDKVYDGSAAATTSLADNRITGDNLVVSGVSNFIDKNAGSNKAVTVTGLSLSGADAINYIVNGSISTTADINKANLVVKAESAGKASGAVDAPIAWSIQSGQLYGSDALTGSLGRATGEAAGSYALNQGTLSAGTNYNLSLAAGDYVISKPLVNVDLEQAKEVVSTVTLVSKVTATVAAKAAEPVAPTKTDTSSVLGDYRLLNLGIKLPEDTVAPAAEDKKA
jgi:filamentous hemagglutinin family protein